MGIGKTIGGVGFKFAGARLEAIDSSVIIANWPSSGLDLGAVEDAIAEKNGSARFVADGIGGMMRIGRGHAHQYALHPIAFAVAVGVANEPEIGRLHQEDAVFVKLETGRRIEVINEMRAFVGLASAFGVLEQDQAVADFAVGRAFRVVVPNGDPETAFGVPRHLDRFDRSEEHTSELQSHSFISY